MQKLSPFLSGEGFVKFFQSLIMPDYTPPFTCPNYTQALTSDIEPLPTWADSKGNDFHPWLYPSSSLMPRANQTLEMVPNLVLQQAHAPETSRAVPATSQPNVPVPDLSSRSQRSLPLNKRQRGNSPDTQCVKSTYIIPGFFTNRQKGPILRIPFLNVGGRGVHTPGVSAARPHCSATFAFFIYLHDNTLVLLIEIASHSTARTILYLMFIRFTKRTMISRGLELYFFLQLEFS